MDCIQIELTQLEDWNYSSGKNLRVGRYSIRLDGCPESLDFEKFSTEIEDIISTIKGDGWESAISRNRFEHGASGVSGLVSIVLHDPVFNEAKKLLGVLAAIQITRLVDKYCPHDAARPELQTLDEILPIAHKKLVETFNLKDGALGTPEMHKDNDIIIVEFHGRENYIYARSPNGAELTCWTGRPPDESAFKKMLYFPVRLLRHIFAFRP